MSFSIYLHIPFCRRLCPYCHFYRVPEITDWRVYLEAVIRELDSIAPDTVGSVHTLYVGGGNPTLLPASFYREFIKIIRDRFDLSRLEEAAIETDGEVLQEDLAPLAEAGFNRVSVGIKSFQPEIREILGAGHLSLQDPVAAARTAGFTSVNLDLVYGMGGQEMEEFVSDLEQILKLAPDHVSLYALEEMDGIGPRQGDPDMAAAMFRESLRNLHLGGYRQYEITNFAKPGHRSVHNTVYWRDGDYIGLGPSAHSSMTRDGTRVRWRNRPEIAAYMEDPAGCWEEISREDGANRAREALILGLRMAEGVDRTSFTNQYGFDPLELLRGHLRDLIESGLLRCSTGRVRLTTRGMLLSNEVFVRLLPDD